jgi:hypothetical protein
VKWEFNVWKNIMDVDFHMGCIVLARLVVFWVHSAIEFSICAYIYHGCGHHTK